jgi:hypothetical protein
MVHHKMEHNKDKNRNIEQYLENTFLERIKGKFGVHDIEKPSQQYKDSLLKMLDNTQVKPRDVMDWLPVIRIKKLKYMTKEEKEMELDYVKLMMIMNNILTKNMLQNPNLSPADMYNKVIKDIEDYK